MYYLFISSCVDVITSLSIFKICGACNAQIFQNFTKVVTH